MSTGSPNDRAFAGSIPQIYERYLVPLIFESYAEDLARRVAARRPARVLEIGAGTGVVTRRLARELAPDAAIVASDLNAAMLQEAQARLAGREVEWRVADVMALPFADGEFDVVVCQFAAMFFPEKAKAFGEVRRVLRAGGAFIFNVWDRIETNEFADEITRAVAAEFASSPPLFLARTPHGYHDHGTIAADLAQGGFDRDAQFETVAERSRADSPRIPAIAYCQGTPMRGEIEGHGPGALAKATDIAAAAIAWRFGEGAVDGKIQAHVVTVEV
jgi:ubiquinone/menaquinone biosynthesis C-methylase UbiE